MSGLIKSSQMTPAQAQSVASSMTLEQGQQLANRAGRQSVIDWAIRMGLGGLGAGMALRGGQGLLNLLRRSGSPPRTARPPSIIDMPVGEEEEEKVAGFLDTLSEWGSDWKKFITSPIKYVSEQWTEPAVAKGRPGPPAAPRESLRWPVGGWMVPGITALGGVGLGWKGMDYLMDRARERELEEEKQRVMEAYEAALAGHGKIGEALDAELNALFDKLGESHCSYIEKVAFTPNALLNVYGLWALASGAIPGIWAYNATRAKQKSVALEAARKKLLRQRETTRPSPMYVRPRPLSESSTMKTAPDEDELQGSPLDKAASFGLVMFFAR